MSQYAEVSVVVALPHREAGTLLREEVSSEGRFWELRCHYRASSSRFTPYRKLVNLRRYWRSMMIGWRRLLRERGMPDTLNAHIMVRPALVAWWLGRRHGLPYVISEQSSEYLDGTYAAKGAAFHWLSRYLFRRSVVITAVSKWLGDALVAHGLCDRYEVVPNVVPGLDRELPPPGERGRLLMVADLVDRTKNVSGVLRALAKARKSDARPRLMLIGDGPDRAALGALVGDLGLEGHVEFLGRLPNSAVLDHMGRAWAVVINSNYETFSVVTGEALAQGRPVIATRCGGPEAFVTPANGILIEPGDDDALCMALLHLLQSDLGSDPSAIRGTVGERCGPQAVGQAFLMVHQALARP